MKIKQRKIITTTNYQIDSRAKVQSDDWTILEALVQEKLVKWYDFVLLYFSLILQNTIHVFTFNND